MCVEDYAGESSKGGLSGLTRVGETPSSMGKTFYELSISEDPVVGGVYALNLQYTKLILGQRKPV